MQNKVNKPQKPEFNPPTLRGTLLYPGGVRIGISLYFGTTGILVGRMMNIPGGGFTGYVLVALLLYILMSIFVTIKDKSDWRKSYDKEMKEYETKMRLYLENEQKKEAAKAKAAAREQRAATLTPEEQFQEFMGYHVKYQKLHNAADYDEAMFWGGKAAKNDHIEAQRILGISYNQSHYLHKAAERGDNEAIYHFAKAQERNYRKVLSDNQFFLEDLTSNDAIAMLRYWQQAVYWYIKSFDNASADSRKADVCITLAELYMDWFKRPNWPEAIYWWKEATKFESTSLLAIKMLAEIYSGPSIIYNSKYYNLRDFHDSVNKEWHNEQAAKWAYKGAKLGDAESQIILGNLLLYGEEKNIEAAFEWIEKAAEQGNAEAQCRLGELYLSNHYSNNEDSFRIVKEKDTITAKRWLERAAAQGNKKAKEMLLTRSLFS